jgi:hypothetical protein
MYKITHTHTFVSVFYSNAVGGNMSGFLEASVLLLHIKNEQRHLSQLSKYILKHEKRATFVLYLFPFKKQYCMMEFPHQSVF